MIHVVVSAFWQFRHLIFRYSSQLYREFRDLTVEPSIGVGRLRILGGQGLEYWGGPRGGANSQQAHDVVLTTMRRNDVASTSFRRHVPTRFLINQCQIITFLTVKSDNIETEE